MYWYQWQIALLAPRIPIWENHAGDCKAHLSSPREVKSGVPQGSVLGPIIFLVYINHIAANLTCHYKIFADDLKIYTCIDSVDTEAGTMTLQSDINLLHSTAKSWGLHMNSRKCAALRFQRRSGSQESPTYTLDGQLLLLLQLSGDPAGRSSGLPEEASPPHEPQHRVRVALQHCQRRDVAQESGPRRLVLKAVADDVLGVFCHATLRTQAVSVRPEQ